MAKMFYSLEEAADKLGVSADEVKTMASSGKLQQFRDRDKLMFKRDQVDGLSQNKDSLGAGLEEVIGLAQNEANSSTGTTTDAISLNDEPAPGKGEDPRQKTGVSVFDADEVEEADPMAQTQMTNTIEESDTDLMIESVGSGSGLLDLTRESDDTSLGAELLDEIYPTGGGESPEIGSGNENRASNEDDGSGGVFDSAIAAEPSTSGLDNLAENTSTMESPGIVTVGSVEEIYDPVSSWFANGALLGATITLGVAFTIAVGSVAGVPSVPQMYLANQTNLGIGLAVFLVGSLILAGAGFGFGKLRANS